MNDNVTRAVTGSSDTPSVASAEAIGKAAAKLDELAEQMKEARDTDTARFTALGEEQKAQAAILTDLQKDAQAKARDAELDQAIEDAKEAKAFADSYRAPSKARVIGTGGRTRSSGEYQSGDFLGALMTYKDINAYESDRREAKAKLEQIGSYFSTPDENNSKATLGTTDATGGWVIPNSIVEPFIKTGRYAPGVAALVTSRNGMGDAYQVDIPFRRAAPARMVVAPWGDTKENTGLTYEGYTATMYTVARIYDIAKQFARKSRGAAEQDVIEELQHAADLGKSYYILRGSGSSEPYGLQTALALGGASSFTSAFTASTTTLAGSVAKAIATAAGALATRDRQAEAAVLHSVGYWDMVSQGTDSAGFFFAPLNGPEGIRPGTLVSPFGIPVIPDNQVAGTDDLIVGEWSALKVYYGDGLRIDSTEVAGERWDKNLIGFRGEFEMGLDARPAVFAGAFQFVADVAG